MGRVVRGVLRVDNRLDWEGVDELVGRERVEWKVRGGGVVLNGGLWGEGIGVVECHERVNGA